MMAGVLVVMVQVDLLGCFLVSQPYPLPLTNADHSTLIVPFIDFGPES